MGYDRTDIGIGGAIWVAGISLFITTGISIYNISSHFRNLYYKEAQEKCMLIESLPITGWLFWLVLLAGEKYVVAFFIADIIEATIVIAFTKYIFNILGWESDGSYSWEKAQETVESLGQIKHTSKCFGVIDVSSKASAKSFLNRILYCTYEFLVVLVILLVISLVLEFGFEEDYLEWGVNEPEYGYLWINSALIVSTVVAIFHLITFSRGISGLEELKDLRMGTKFMLIELAIMITKLEELVISGVVSTGIVADLDDNDQEEVTLFVNNLLLCFEMVILAFVQNMVFGPEEYKVSILSGVENSYEEQKDYEIKEVLRWEVKRRIFLFRVGSEMGYLREKAEI